METLLLDPIMSAESHETPSHKRRVLLVESSKLSGETMAKKFNQLDCCLAERVDDISSVSAIINVSMPDFLVLSVDYLSEPDLVQLSRLTKVVSIPLIVFARKNAPSEIKSVVEAGVNTYIVDDVSSQRLPVILDLAFERFSQMQKVSSELEQTKKRLSERKLIEKAKGIIMRQKNYTEDQAYMEIRKSAMNQGKSMAELATKIISLFDEVLD